MKSKPSSSTSAPTNLSFTASLSSLLATSAATKPKPPSLTRPTPSTSSRDNIFTTHNRNSRKRAAADISTDPLPQTHSTTSADVSTATLSRSRRKMEEKARLYSAMKRGDYVPSPSPSAGSLINRETEGLVDFDRKHAEAVCTANPLNGSIGSSSDGDDDDDDDDGSDMLQKQAVTVEYEDELGRTRTGTRAQAEKCRRRRAAAAYATRELEAAAGRPHPPAVNTTDGGPPPGNLILGDRIQHAAFNPDAVRERAMEELAGRRDRSVTPPEEVRYDARKEVRSKGVGFYQFSRDREGRERELGELGREREETERVRGEREAVVERKRRVVEERRRVIEEMRRKKEADAFLEGLDVGGSGGGG